MTSHPPTPLGRPRSQAKLGTPLALLVLVLLVVGGASTALWLSRDGSASLVSVLSAPAALLSVAACVVLTSLNVGLRWFRWHFLVRRMTRSLTTRDSFAVYLATLPSIVTPFMVGELVRVLLLRKRVHVPTKFLVRVWFAERLLEASVLFVFYLWCVEPSMAGLATFALLGGTPVLYRVVLPASASGKSTHLGFAALAITVAAWTLPIVGLYLTLLWLTPLANFAAAVHAFTAGTLFGGLTGLPLGVFVTGSTMIAELTASGLSAAEGVTVVLLYRAGTSWFAVALGLLALVRFRRRLGALLSDVGGDHFDDIASVYEDEIPAHVRDRLLSRKVTYIRQALSEAGVGAAARGLDVGCGQGWYFIEFVRAGYRMTGLDYSSGQVDRARVNLRDSGVEGVEAIEADLRQGDAMALPYADNSFDFAYSINAFHHILAPDGQRRALCEVVRVLRPGGVFVLHEMNTYNPLFRLYMGYVFPLIKKIDEGNEIWLMPNHLPVVPGAHWSEEKSYFTFLPDFVPSFVQRALAGLEKWLERSALRQFSAHYQACLIKDGDVSQ